MAGAPLFEGPVKLNMGIYCAVPASWSNKKRQAALRGEVFPTTKPDIDNVIKAACDSLNGVVWRDDVQVVWLTSSKHYDESPRLFVSIEAL